MKKEEIQEYLKTVMGLNFSKEHLIKPDSDFVLELLSDILDKMNLIKKEKIVKISINEMKIFQFSGIQDKAFLYKKFYNSIEKFVKNRLKITNFLTEDIFAPTEKKLKHILSAIINYHKFITEERNSTKTMKESYYNSIENLNNISKEFDKKKVILQNLRIQKENEKLSASILSKECEELCIKVQSSERRINEQKQEIQFHIDELNEIEDKTKALDPILENNNSRIKVLKSQLIVNPEQLINVNIHLIKHNEELKLAIPILQSFIENCEKTVNFNEKKRNCLSFLDKSVNELETVFRNYSSLFDKSKELLNKIQEKSEALLKKERECQNFIMEIESKTNAHKALEMYVIEREENLQKSYEVVIEENKQLKEKYDRENRNLLIVSEDIKNQIIICKKLERIIEEKTNSIAENYNKCLEEFENLDKITDNMVENMSKSLNL